MTRRPGRCLRARAVATVAALLLAATGAGCAGDGQRQPPEPVRGVILVSIDTLRADHLSAYGYGRPTSPFLDRLASRGVLFEQAIVQYPSTLTSHMTMLTGLYPAEHAVYPPESVLSPEIPTLAELFERAGWRTAGFTEDGFMEGRYGFSRGFERWSDDAASTPTDVETTFARGVEFLRGLGPEERFFLFLHTYAVHDPYDPPEPYRSRFVSGPPPADAFTPNGVNLVNFNRRDGELSGEAVAYFEALYDASIRYVDDQLEALFATLVELGLTGEIAVVITSDHGEEFLEHGKLAHTQLYHPVLHVPLLIVHPQLAPRRMPGLVESVSLTPTLLELAGLEVPEHISVASLVPEMIGAAGWRGREAYGEVWQGINRTLYRQDGSGLVQVVRSHPSPDGWFGRRAVFDVGPRAVRFQLKSDGTPRRVEVRVDGEHRRTLELGATWSPVHLEAAGGKRKRRVEIVADGCRPLRAHPDEPTLDGCRGFQLSDADVERLELFDLEADPEGVVDISRRRPRTARDLLRRLAGYRFKALAPASREALDPELERRLRALGYL